MKPVLYNTRFPCVACHQTYQHSLNYVACSLPIMPQAGFEPAIPATKYPQAYALDRAATGISQFFCLPYISSPFKISGMEGRTLLMGDQLNDRTLPT
jgi:hypothetical protein